MRSLNLNPVTKNLIIINILVYIITLVGQQQHIPIAYNLSAHYFNSPLFEPYQIITHMFVHSTFGLGHIFMNMFGLYLFGNHLERVWGAKKFFIVYIASGLGALLLYGGIGTYEIMQLKQQLIAIGYSMDDINNWILGYQEHLQPIGENSEVIVRSYESYAMSSMAGASGALFGILAAFGILFPNTDLYIMFLPMPIKAKYLIGGYVLYEIYSSIYQSNDNIAHLAHVGGAIVGAAFVLYSRKFDKKNFY